MESLKAPYHPPFLFKSGHFNTLITNLWRESQIKVNYQRNRIKTKDEDFLDLDLSQVGSKNGCLLVHGLGGDTYSAYMKGMTKAVNEAGYDAIALNQRGCSGEINYQPVTYHSGKTEDIGEAVDYSLNRLGYDQLILTGFSLGGNLVLKYAGEHETQLDSRIKGIAAIANPFDLKLAALRMHQFQNKIYEKRFLKNLKHTALAKKRQFPNLPTHQKNVLNAKNFFEFDEVFTAPVNGFKDAETYYALSSSKNFLAKIQTSTLLVNASDDPFIPPQVFPHGIIDQNPNLTFLNPQYGGHVGFGDWGLNQELWHEEQFLFFTEKNLIK